MQLHLEEVLAPTRSLVHASSLVTLLASRDRTAPQLAERATPATQIASLHRTAEQTMVRQPMSRWTVPRQQRNAIVRFGPVGTSAVTRLRVVTTNADPREKQHQTCDIQTRRSGNRDQDESP